MNSAPDIIDFDPDAIANGGPVILGPYCSKETLETACSTMSPAHPKWDLYHAWALQHGADPDSGSIFTTADNQPLLERRQWTLFNQLRNFARAARGEETNSKLNHVTPPDLKAGFAEAARAVYASARLKEFRTLMIASTYETLFFDMRKDFPALNLSVVCAVENQEHADRCNDLVASVRPEVSQKLVYETSWRGQGFNLVSVNAALFYNDENGVRRLIEDIANTGASHVFFNNIMPNENENGAAEWFGQRYSGGVIPLRTPARGELEALMKEADYKLVRKYSAPATFDHNPKGAFARQFPEMDNFSFTLA